MVHICQFWVQWHHVDNLQWTMSSVFTPWQLEKAAIQGFYSSELIYHFLWYRVNHLDWTVCGLQGFKEKYICKMHCTCGHYNIIRGSFGKPLPSGGLLGGEKGKTGGCMGGAEADFWFQLPLWSGKWKVYLEKGKIESWISADMRAPVRNIQQPLAFIDLTLAFWLFVSTLDIPPCEWFVLVDGQSGITWPSRPAPGSLP